SVTVSRYVELRVLTTIVVPGTRARNATPGCRAASEANPVIVPSRGTNARLFAPFSRFWRPAALRAVIGNCEWIEGAEQVPIEGIATEWAKAALFADWPARRR